MRQDRLPRISANIENVVLNGSSVATSTNTNGMNSALSTSCPRMMEEMLSFDALVMLPTFAKL